MTLPAYAMNQSNFAQMYESLLVGPLFRPWVNDLLDRVSLARVIGCWTWRVEQASWPASPRSASATRGGLSPWI